MIKALLARKRKEDLILDTIHDYFASKEAAAAYFGIEETVSASSLKLKVKSNKRFALVQLRFSNHVNLMADKEIVSYVEKKLHMQKGIDSVVSLYEAEVANRFYIQVWYK